MLLVFALSGVVSSLQAKQYKRYQIKRHQLRTRGNGFKKSIKFVALRPDLTIKTSQLVQSNVYKLKVTVANRGFKASGPCILQVEDVTNGGNGPKKNVYFYGLKGASQIVGPMYNPKNERTIYVTCPFTVYGNKKILVTIDANKTISESKENNNTDIIDTLIK